MIQTKHPGRVGLIQSHKSFIRRWIPTWSQTSDDTDVRAALLSTLQALLHPSWHRDLCVQTLWNSSRKPKSSSQLVYVPGDPSLSQNSQIQRTIQITSEDNKTPDMLFLKNCVSTCHVITSCPTCIPHIRIKFKIRIMSRTLFFMPYS